MKIRTDIDIQRALQEMAGPDDTAEVYGLLEQVKAYVPEHLYFGMEEAINARDGETFDRAFVAGWKAAKEPELLIFQKVDQG